MWAIHWLIFASILPKVEDPWPSSIGMDLPFTIAGAGGVFGAVVSFHIKPEGRDKAAMLGGLIGFWAGALFYFVALANQLVFRVMKRFVGSRFFQALYLGLGALLLVGIVQAETVISFLIVIGVLAFTIQQAWVGRRGRQRRPTAGKL